ncbi:MAG: hypothetical protein KY468_10845 [Armatimonadetes bacterium]|nr:hypothetical protein [Armatimonadota bacterium]
MTDVNVLGVYMVPGHIEVHLIEALVNAAPDEFDPIDITQEDPSLPKSDWQVAYDEKYLNREGDQIIGDYYEKPGIQEAPTRIAFFFHYLDFEKPLLTSLGPVPLPAPVEMPHRLASLIEYEEVD